jgi:outer membrane protein assembly factor BamB
MLVCSDSVGSFIASGDYIIYQNLSDNGKLYSIKTDGTNRQKLIDPTCPTDFTATSFVVLDGQLLFFDSSDNNNLYTFDPSTSKYTRLCIMNGSQLKIINKSLYFINGDDSNNLYSLSVDFNASAATYKPEISQGINEYYLTSAGIFYSPSINVNNIYFKKFPAQS